MATGLPTANNRPHDSRHATTPSSARASAALYHVTDRVSVWGAVELRIPRADAHRALPPVLGRRDHDPSQRSARARAAGRRRSRRQRRAGAQRHGPRDLVRQPHRRIRCSNVTLNATHGAEAEPRRDAHPGRADRRRVPPRLVAGAFSGGYVYDQAKVTDGGVANAALVGKYLPQVPKHRGSLQVGVLERRSTRPSRSACSSSALQYNDDLNVNFIPVADADRGRLRRSFTRPGCRATRRSI